MNLALIERLMFNPQGLMFKKSLKMTCLRSEVRVEMAARRRLTAQLKPVEEQEVNPQCGDTLLCPVRRLYQLKEIFLVYRWVFYCYGASSVSHTNILSFMPF